MGTFVGHAGPAIVLILYGITSYLQYLEEHFKLISPKYALSQSSLSQSKRSSSARFGYWLVMLYAFIHALVEIIQWHGVWHQMTSLQHATMLWLVFSSALTGLCMSYGLLPVHARVQLGFTFILTGFMLYAHASHGALETGLHAVEAYLFWLAGLVYLVYAMLHAAIQHYPNSCIRESDDNDVQLHSFDALPPPLLQSFWAMTARLSSFAILLAGTWFMWIAFAEWQLQLDDSMAHLIWVWMSWHVMGAGLFCSALETSFKVKYGTLDQPDTMTLAGFGSLSKFYVADIASAPIVDRPAGRSRSTKSRMSSAAASMMKRVERWRARRAGYNAVSTERQPFTMRVEDDDLELFDQPQATA